MYLDYIMNKEWRKAHITTLRKKLDNGRYFIAGISAIFASLFIASWLIYYFELSLSQVNDIIEAGRLGKLGVLLNYLIIFFVSGMSVIIITLAMFLLAVSVGYIIIWLMGLFIRPFIFLYTHIYDLIVRMRD